MALTLRQYLRTLEKDKLKELFELETLTKYERNLLTMCFIHKYRVDKTCRLLHISKTKYHYSLNEALIKMQCFVTNLDKLHTFTM